MRDNSEKTPKMFRLPKTHGFRNELEPSTKIDPTSEAITKAFKLMSGEETGAPVNEEYDQAVADIKKDTESTSVLEEKQNINRSEITPAEKTVATDEANVTEGLKFSILPEPPKEIPAPKFSKLPEDESITKRVKEYAEKKAGTNETAGFTSAGERIRIRIPDDPTDPDRVERITRLGLSAIRSLEAKRDKENKKDK